MDRRVRQNSTLLTILFVEDQLRFVFFLALQGIVYCLGLRVRSLLPVEKLARAALRHDLSAAISGQLAETVRAVDDWPAGSLRVAKHEVAVWKPKRKETNIIVLVPRWWNCLKEHDCFVLRGGRREKGEGVSGGWGACSHFQSFSGSV